MESAVLRALLDEFQKHAASKSQMTVSQSRTGRRPMSVETMLKKDEDGTLFKKQSSLSWDAALDEFAKIATGVSVGEATDAMNRLDRLEKSKQSKGEILRGAVAGSGLGVAGNLLSSSIAGTRQPLKRLPRQVAGAAVPGMLIGAALPMVKQHMNEEAEKEKLRSHLGISGVSPTRSKVRQALGFG